MTLKHDFTLPTELLEQVSSQGIDILPELIRVMINSAMQVERQQYLGGVLMSILRNAGHMPMISSRRGSKSEWARLPLMCLRCEKAVSIPML